MAEGEQAPKVCPTCGTVLYMQRVILHHFSRASTRGTVFKCLSTGMVRKNDAKLTAVCIRGAALYGHPTRWLRLSSVQYSLR
jgi:hypothetical protein